MKEFFNKVKKNRGFTIVCAILAITIIVVCCVAATGSNQGNVEVASPKEVSSERSVESSETSIAVEESAEESSEVVSNTEISKVETSKVETSKVETAKVEASEVEASKVETAKVETKTSTVETNSGYNYSKPATTVARTDEGTKSETSKNNNSELVEVKTGSSYDKSVTTVAKAEANAKAESEAKIAAEAKAKAESKLETSKPSNESTEVSGPVQNNNVTEEKVPELEKDLETSENVVFNNAPGVVE